MRLISRDFTVVDAIRSVYLETLERFEHSSGSEKNRLHRRLAMIEAAQPAYVEWLKEDKQNG